MSFIHVFTHFLVIIATVATGEIDKGRFELKLGKKKAKVTREKTTRRQDFGKLIGCLAHLEYKLEDTEGFIEKFKVNFLVGSMISNYFNNVEFITKCREVSHKFQFGPDGCFGALLDQFYTLSVFIEGETEVFEHFKKYLDTERSLRVGYFDRVRDDIDDGYFSRANMTRREKIDMDFIKGLNQMGKGFKHVYKTKCKENEKLRQSNYKCYSSIQGKVKKFEGVFDLEFTDDDFLSILGLSSGGILDRYKGIFDRDTFSMEFWEELYRNC